MWLYNWSFLLLPRLALITAFALPKPETSTTISTTSPAQSIVQDDDITLDISHLFVTTVDQIPAPSLRDDLIRKKFYRI